MKTLRARPFALVVCVLALLAATAGCRASSATIGPMGGTVRSGDGASVTIPPGALSTETQISLTAADRTMLPGGGVAGGRAYHLEPDGLVFAQPVSVIVPYDPQALPANTTVTDLRLMTAPAGASGYAFEMVTSFSTSASRPFLTATTYHFSDVWIAAVNTPSPGYRQNSTGLQGGASGASLVTFGSSPTDIPRDICAERGDVCACDHCGAGTLPCCGDGVCVSGVCRPPTGTGNDAGTTTGDPCGWAQWAQPTANGYLGTLCVNHQGAWDIGLGYDPNTGIYMSGTWHQISSGTGSPRMSDVGPCPSQLPAGYQFCESQTFDLSTCTVTYLSTCGSMWTVDVRNRVCTTQVVDGCNMRTFPASSCGLAYGAYGSSTCP